MGIVNAAIDKMTRGSPAPSRSSGSRSPSTRPADDDDDEDNGRPTYIPLGPSPEEVAAQRAAAQARAEASERAAAQERAAKEQAARAAEKSKREESLYTALTQAVRDTNKFVRDARDVIENPFDGAGKIASRESVDALMRSVGQATLPGSAPVANDRLDRADNVVAVARTFGMAGNPFAEKTSARDGRYRVH